MITIHSSGPGLHHNFLRFTLDYLSQLTPDLKQFPFDDTGCSHNDKGITFSKKFNLIMGQDIVDKNIKSCISFNPDDLLYYERVSLSREGSRNNDLYNLKNFNSWQPWNKDYVEQIYQFYNINKDEKIPKFILRDSIKKGYLNPKNTGLYKNTQKIINQIKELPNYFIVPVTAFFSFDSYKNELKKIDEKFNLELDLNELPILYKTFYEKNYVLKTHNIVFEILEAVKKQLNFKIPALDVFQEGYIYAELEKNNDFIIMPLIDNFFKNTNEIINYIKFYPEHYKAMNPNLPMFNNIPNPFFLHRQNNK
jgi:hypothetical protein